MRPPLQLPELPPSANEAIGRAGIRLGDLLTPVVKLGVTGLSRSGKTVFITALVRNLVSGGRLPFFSPDAEGRILRAYLEPQPDDAVPRFDYEAHIAALSGDPPVWPQSTRRISELRVTIEYVSQYAWRRMLGPSRLHLDIVDYPGEWLIDLPLLEMDFAAWSRQALSLARAPGRIVDAQPFLAFLNQLPVNTGEQAVLEGARLFTEYLKTARGRDSALATLTPGRFLMPGDLAGSPLLTVFPLDEPHELRDELSSMLSRRFDSYKTHVVRPFFRDHFLRLNYDKALGGRN